jgi:hypothetical protein
MLELIQLYPNDIRVKDDDNELPLHLALNQYGSDIVIEKVIHLYPDALQYPDYMGHRPFHTL